MCLSDTYMYILISCPCAFVGWSAMPVVHSLLPHRIPTLLQRWQPLDEIMPHLLSGSHSLLFDVTLNNFLSIACVHLYPSSRKCTPGSLELLFFLCFPIVTRIKPLQDLRFHWFRELPVRNFPYQCPSTFPTSLWEILTVLKGSVETVSGRMWTRSSCSLKPAFYPLGFAHSRLSINVCWIEFRMNPNQKQTNKTIPSLSLMEGELTG